MSPAIKFLIGAVATAAMTWLHQGPLGNGEAYIGRIEAEAKRVVADTGVPGVNVDFSRSPLSRQAQLSGNADTFQREGQGELKGINGRVGEIEGVSGVRWADEPERTALPLLLEVMILTLLAYLVGVGLARLLWGRRKREGFY